MRMLRCYLISLVVILLVGHFVPCSAKEKYTVRLSYPVGPKNPLPEGLKAVAVIDSGVLTEGDREGDREKKWSTIAADMIEAMVQNSAMQFGTGIGVAKRRETRAVLAEQDLKLAGLVDGPTAMRAGKLLAVQALIVSRIHVRIDIQRGTKSTIDWLGMMGQVASQMQESRTREQRPSPGYGQPPPRPQPQPLPRDNHRKPVVVRRPWDARNPNYRRDPANVYDKRYQDNYYKQKSTSVSGGLELKTRDVEEISRALTIQCSFAMIDAATGEAIVQYSPPPFQKHDKKTPHFLFGSNMDEADLDPVDMFIGELVEKATQEFVGMIVPVQVEYTYDIESKGKESDAGVRLLRADDYAGAVRMFEASLARKNEHQNVFNLGLTAELMGDRTRALQCYRQASAAERVDKEELAIYLAAKQRLADHIERIWVPKVAVPTPVPAAPAEPPTPVPAESAAPTPATPNGWSAFSDAVESSQPSNK